jgi:hypothetical protein
MLTAEGKDASQNASGLPPSCDTGDERRYHVSQLTMHSDTYGRNTNRPKAGIPIANIKNDPNS